VKAWVTFGVLVTHADPQKIQRASKESKEMRFAGQPNG
jgi:hypothetical protein